MALRCGYSTDGYNLFCDCVDVNWDKGFNHDSKVLYIKELTEKLESKFAVVKDVTTASPERRAQMLSPHCLMTPDGRCVQQASMPDWSYPGLFDFFYWHHIDASDYDYIKSIDCFVDVFHNPAKGHGTQARSLAMFKMLMLQGKMEYLYDINKFIEWFNENYSVIKREVD